MSVHDPWEKIGFHPGDEFTLGGVYEDGTTDEEPINGRILQRWEYVGPNFELHAMLKPLTASYWSGRFSYISARTGAFVSEPPKPKRRRSAA